jgi:cell division cycle 14
VLTENIVPVAMTAEPSGASYAPARESAASSLPPLLPISALTYVEDRLYLASYTSPPTEDTLFPYPPEPSAKRSPNKRSTRAIDGPTIVSDKRRIPPYYFCVDDTLLYNAFHHDFGPLHIGHLYRFAVYLHDILGAPENKDKPVVFWSKADARSTFISRFL